MKINKNNYEIYFLDYYEGTLSAPQIAELFLFLQQHPELKEEFESFENITLEPEKTTRFDKKAILKKADLLPEAINENNYEIYLAAALESDLNAAGKERLDAFMQQHPPLEKDRKLFQKTILVPDQSIVFEDKLALKHNSKKRAGWYYYVAIAASISLLISFYQLWQPGQKSSQKQPVAINTNQVNSKPAKSTQQKVHRPVAKSNPNHVRSTAVPMIISQQKRPAVTNIQQIAMKNAALPQKNKTPDINASIQPVIATAITTMDTNAIVMSQKQPAVTKQIGSGFLSLRQFAAEQFRRRVLKESFVQAQKQVSKHQKIKGWDIVKLAASIYHKVTGKNIRLQDQYDNRGDLVAYDIDTPGLEIRHSRGR